MGNAVSALTTTLSAEAIWTEFATVAPFVGAITLVAIGFYLVRRATKKASKLKGGA